MKTLINVRYTLFAFVGIIVGILCAYSLYYGHYVAFFLPISLFVVLAVVLKLLKNKNCFAVVLLLIFALIGITLFYVDVYKFDKKERMAEGVLVGRVTDTGKNTSEIGYYLYLDDCTFETKDGTENLKGKVKVLYYFASDVEVGTKVETKGTLHSVYYLKDSVDTYSLRSNVAYEFDCNEIKTVGTLPLKVDERCRLYVYEKFTEFMPYCADIAYSLVTGDKTPVHDEDLLSFRQAGIIHVLAVSGLHVGFVITVLGFLLKWIKSPLLKYLAMLPFLVGYAYVCGFAPSVMRAIVMSGSLFLVKQLHGETDLLSSLSFAGVLILIIEPLYVFDVGFVLSFLSVFGIATVTATVKRCTDNWKLPKITRKVVDAFSVSLGASLGTFCAVLLVYGEVSVVGVVINLLVIPLITVAFIVAFVGLIPFASKLLVVPSFVLQVISTLANKVSKLSFATVQFETTVLSCFLIAVALFVVGGFVNVSGRHRRLVISSLILLSAVSALISAIPTKCEDSISIDYSYNGITVVATSDEGNVVVFNNFTNDYDELAVEKYLSQKVVSSCNVVLTDFSACDVNCLKAFDEYVGINKVYVLSFDGNTLVENYLHSKRISIVRVPENMSFGTEICCRSVCDDSLCGYVVCVNDMRVAVTNRSGPVLRRFPEKVGKVSALVSFDSSDYLFEGAEGLVLSRYQSAFDGNYGANKYGNFTLREINGKITMVI